jgi:hypothetical protein
MGDFINNTAKGKCAKFVCTISTQKKILSALFGILFLSTSYITSAQTTVFTISQPVQPSSSQPGNDGQALELGMKFRPTLNGFITALRFYKSAENTGTHIGQLWSSTGTLLAQEIYTNETASGWQEVVLPAAVAVTAGTTYVVSYHSSEGNYSATQNFFTSAIVNGPLTGLADGTDGANGLYSYTNSPAFPTSSYKSSNYWIDVVFNTSTSTDQTPPKVSATTPSSNATGVATSIYITANMSEPLKVSTVSASTVLLKAGSANIAASVSWGPETNTITLIPSAALSSNTLYTVIIKGGATGVRDVAGNALASDYVWSFTTTAPDNQSSPNLSATRTPTIYLGQNYPNPVKLYTTIIYKVQENVKVELDLFDCQGRIVKRMVNEVKLAGKYTYYLNTQNLNKGIYLYRLQTPQFSTFKKLIIE